MLLNNPYNKYASNVKSKTPKRFFLRLIESFGADMRWVSLTFTTTSDRGCQLELYSVEVRLVELGYIT